MQDERESTKKATQNRVQTNTRGKRVDSIDIGRFVTRAVPRKNCHRTDQRCLPGVVINKRDGHYIFR